MLGQLEVIAGPDKGRSFPLDEGQVFQIGRGPSTHTKLSDRCVSRQHCQLKVENSMVVLSDLGSSTGTRVNGIKIEQPQRLLPGDVITMGTSELRLDMLDVHQEGTALLPAAIRSPAPPSAERLSDLSQLVGKRLGHFTIERELAQGQTSVVFRARAIDEGQIVALKVLRPELADQADLVKRFLSNMKLMQALRHPNLVEVYKADRTDALCWMTMEYVEGKSLKQIINGIGMFGILDWRYALRVAVHVTRGLAFAQSKAILHRNITPKNILIRQADNVAKLADMLLAKVFEGTDNLLLSIRGKLCSDMGYQAPERVASKPVADSRTDLYELGATIYALLTGHPPCVGSNPVNIVDKLKNEIPPSTKSVQLSVPDQFDRVVLRLLAKRPEDRYHQADQLLSDLEAIARSHDLTIV